jgi:uncharacterized OB-fold protein
MVEAVGVELAAARCPHCGLVVYPQNVTSCPRCTTEPLDRVNVPGDGVVWSYTVQRFAPKSPPYRPTGEQFEPFVVAYVQTSDGGRIAGVVEGIDPPDVRIGMPVRLISCHDVPRYLPATSRMEAVTP